MRNVVVQETFEVVQWIVMRVGLCVVGFEGAREVWRAVEGSLRSGGQGRDSGRSGRRVGVAGHAGLAVVREGEAGRGRGLDGWRRVVDGRIYDGRAGAGGRGRGPAEGKGREEGARATRALGRGGRRLVGRMRV